MSKLLQPAKQDRSRETQERILAATARLLAKNAFDEISIRQIIKEAETSTGSFYARFRDKNALLPVLYAQYDQKLRRRLVRLKDSLIRARSLQSVAQLIVEHFVDSFGEIPNLNRALYEYVTRTPEAAESKGLGQRRIEQHAFLNEALLSFRDEIKHDDPVRAVELGLYFMIVTCRNRLLYPQAPQTRALKISQTELKLELVRLLIGYLRG